MLNTNTESSKRTMVVRRSGLWLLLVALALPASAQWRTRDFMQREPQGQTAVTISRRAPSILTKSPLPTAMVGKGYSQTLLASGATPIRWAVTSGTLPAGLTLGSFSGAISGSPTASGVSTLTIGATNARGSNSKQLSLTVSAPLTPPSVVTTSPLSTALVGTVYSQTLAASGTTPITWAVTGGTLPAGLTLGFTSGTISGTPAASGVSALTVSATNARGSNSKQLTLTVNAPPTAPVILTTSHLPTAQAGSVYSQSLAASGTTPITWSVTSGTLPAGLNLITSTGVIKGTLTGPGMSTFTVTATNALGSDSLQLELTLPPPPIGINMSEAEYSWGAFPGASDLAYLKSNNINLIRLPIAWERAQPHLAGPLDPTYLSAMKAFIAAAGAQGMQVIVDVHNYGRYNSQWAQDAAANYGYVAVGKGDLIGSAFVPMSAFADLWVKLAAALKGTLGLTYYDIMNEPYNMGGPDVWPTVAQAAVSAIRSVDSNTSILVQGTQWASARWWQSDNGNLHIVDPANKLLYEAHLYFDSDGSGTYTQSYANSGAYPTVGVDTLQPFLNWLKQNNAKGFLGEFGIPNNDPLWLPVLDNVLTALQAAGLSGTYWNYAFHSATDPAWWPVSDPMSVRIDIPQANPQIGILRKHNEVSPQ